MSQKLCHFCDTYTTCKYRFGLGDASGLARNIEVNGHITPLIVVADGEACQLVAEHRRTAAMKSLGLEEADAYVVDRDSLGDGCHGCGGDCGHPGLVAVVRPQAWGEGADVTFYCNDEPHVYQPTPEEVAETEAFLGRRAMLDAIDGEPLNGGAAIAKAAFGSAGFLFALHLA